MPTIIIMQITRAISCWRNMGTEPVALAKNERVAQGIFYKYLVADGDADIDKAVRGGGFGSTKS